MNNATEIAIGKNSTARATTRSATLQHFQSAARSLAKGEIFARTGKRLALPDLIIGNPRVWKEITNQCPTPATLNIDTPREGS